MTYAQVFLIAHGTILGAVLAATIATVLASGLRLGVLALAKYVLPALLVFYVAGYLMDLQWEGSLSIAMLASQLVMGIAWFPRCFRPGPDAAAGRLGWRWWSPLMLALLAETLNTIIPLIVWRMLLQ